jgi:hypothetical protein
MQTETLSKVRTATDTPFSKEIKLTEIATKPALTYKSFEVKDSENPIEWNLEKVSSTNMTFDLFESKLGNIKQGFESVQFQTWQLVANISSNVLYADDNVVGLECLLDKEEKVFEEREFSRKLFNGFSVEPGTLFKVCLYERQNEERIEIKSGANGLVQAEDFPKMDFYSKFKNLTLQRNIG